MEIGEELRTFEHLNFNHSAVCNAQWKIDRYCALQVSPMQQTGFGTLPLGGAGLRLGEGEVPVQFAPALHPPLATLDPP